MSKSEILKDTSLKKGGSIGKSGSYFFVVLAFLCAVWVSPAQSHAESLRLGLVRVHREETSP
jgi:hypothetical protein